MIKKLLFSLILLFTMAHVDAAQPLRIDPANWFAGMKDPSLQIMFYGKGIRNVKKVTTDYPGVKVDSVVRLDSPNYLFVYLNLKDAQAGEMTLKLDGKKIKYQLKERTMRGEDHKGFTNAACDRTKPSLRHGGDLAGIGQHLDYFKTLGVTALWFTPVLENDWPNEGGNSSYHGYATTDYYKVDPRFGSNDEYCKLIADCHKQGLKVVMDMIFNHCSDYHIWNRDMPSKDWFNNPNYGMQTSYKLTPVLDPYASKIDKAETTDGWFVKSMPDLNQRNPHVIKYLIQSSEWWIETADIDGIRMDTYPYADRKAMAQWMKTLDTEYPNFNTVGETWVTEPQYTAAWQKDSKTDGWWNGFNRIYNSLCYDYLYPNPSSVLAFIENHDTDRFLGNTKDSTMLKQALALLLTINRIPQLYYGTEVLMNGTKEVTDGNVRKDFPGGFPGDKHNCFTAAGRTKAENEMFNWESRLLHWRQGNEVISKGSQTQFIPYNGVYVIARQYQGKTVLTILNGKRADNELNVARYAEVIKDHKTAKDVITGATVDLTKNVPLTQREALIIEY